MFVHGNIENGTLSVYKKLRPGFLYEIRLLAPLSSTNIQLSSLEYASITKS